MSGPGAADSLVHFASALAQQCFINEYVFDIASEERIRVNELREEICAAAISGAAVDPLRLAAMAAYVRLEFTAPKAAVEKVLAE